MKVRADRLVTASLMGVVAFGGPAGQHRVNAATPTPSASHSVIAPGQTPSIDAGCDPLAQTEVVYVLDDGAHGAELWAGDGASSPARLVVDIAPGSVGSDPVLLGSGAGFAYLIADDGTSGPQLWASDGSAEGTRPVWEAPEPVAAFPSGFLGVLDGAAYLLVGRRGAGLHLVRSDGSPDGTTVVTSLSEGSPRRRSRMLGTSAELLAFQTGSGPWVTDGTPDGTRPVDLDILGWVGGVGASLVAVVRGEDTELWSIGPDTDRSELLGRMDDVVVDRSAALPGGAEPSSPMPTLVFPGLDASGAVEPWVTDGTGTGTHPLLDLPAGGGSDPTLVGPLGDATAVFLADDGVNDRGLWFTDGTPGGTRLLAGQTGLGSTARLMAMSTTTRFLQDDVSPPGAGAIWATDGTPERTRLLKPLDRSVHPDTGWAKPAAIGRRMAAFELPRVVLQRQRARFRGRAWLWVADAERGSVGRLMSLPLAQSIATPAFIGSAGRRLLFVVPERGLRGRADAWWPGGREPGFALWATDGTQRGTKRIAVLPEHAAASMSFRGDSSVTPTIPAVVSHGSLLFLAGGAWRSDGTRAGTVQIAAGIGTQLLLIGPGACATLPLLPS